MIPFVLIQVLLALAYGIFVLVHRSVRLTQSQHLRLAKIALILAIVGPILTHAVPSSPGSRTAFREFFPADELGDGKATSGKTKASHPPTEFREMQRELVAGPTAFDRLRAWENSDVGDRAIVLFFALYALAVLVLVFRIMRKTAPLRAALRSAIPVRTLGDTRVVVTTECDIPYSAWTGRTNWVVLPAALLAHRRDLRIALRHEIQHHRTGDTRWTVALEFLAIAFFLNPAIYAWKRALNELQEFSCDEALVGRRGISLHDYAACLLRVAETALESRRAYVGTTCMASAFDPPRDPKSILRRRIEMFWNSPLTAPRKGVGLILGTLISLFAIAFAFGAESLFRQSPHAQNPGRYAVNPTIQKIADRAVREAVAKEKARSGFAIVADPTTGKVLAVAAVDPSGKLPADWALGQILEPASLAKTLVAARAIENGQVAPDTTLGCENGAYRFHDRVYHDWKSGGWDHLTTTETIANSSDLCSIKIGERVGAEDLYRMLIDFGFGPGGSAKDFPTARAGVLPPLENPLWPEMIPAVSAGYGFWVTPLELVQAYGAIANGGTLLLPTGADDVSAPHAVRRVLSTDTSAKTREILRQVGLIGTARNRIDSALYSSAGKTATSFIPDLTQWELIEGRQKGNFAGFIGFAPVKNPRIEVYVGILDPRDGDKSGAHGSAHAAPVFKRIIDEALPALGVAPDRS